MQFHEDRQRKTDEERGKADEREFYRGCDFSGVTAIFAQPAPLYTLEASRLNEKLIEADEVLRNRNGVPPLPTTKVTLFK